MLAVGLDLTVLNVALPTLAADLRLSPSRCCPRDLGR
jgi:hypothetical protein